MQTIPRLAVMSMMLLTARGQSDGNAPPPVAERATHPRMAAPPIAKAPIAASTRMAAESPRLRRLRREVEEDWADAAHHFTDEGDGFVRPPEPSPFAGAKTEWARREGGCASEACRVRLLEDQRNRFRFWQGLPNKGVKPLPWRTGPFEVDRPDDFRRLQLLPIIDDILLMRLDSSQGGSARLCDFVAGGRWNRHGRVRMVTWDQDPVSFHLETGRRHSLGLPYAPPGFDHSPCLTGGDFGTYLPVILPKAAR